MSTIDEDLRAMCEAVVTDIDDDPNEVIDEALDIEFTTNAQREVLGAKIYVTVGGPLVYVDTQERTVEGRWGNAEISLSYYPEAGSRIDDLIAEHWDITA